MDVLFISPGNANGIYQDLSKDYSAIEPPTWALLLAQSCRSVGYKVGIIDINAERLNKNFFPSGIPEWELRKALPEITLFPQREWKLQKLQIPQ